ncbi:glycerophosphodiester phosphodiesterase [Clostridium hydrogeniformans]|uniref:glycerophosphodiester phosphodiesterase n=1 Tax=Clostridium hydrogeniformans TaxID=349933 RepID=UPI000480569B|nr:glycerophosphodiester phosphodiesterase [Clostridium hydrogeniformans]
MNKTLNIAHRGFSGEYAENTMVAFEKAFEAKCDGIETDVQFTKDKIPVLCHDETLDRTSNGSGYIKDYTYKELLNLDFSYRFNSEIKNIKIPTLEELLIFAKDQSLLLNIELKNTEIPYNGLEESVINLIYKYNLNNNVILSSFNHYSMALVKEIDKSIKTGLLYDGNLYKPWDYCTMVGADCLHPQYFSIMSKEIVNTILSKDIMINTYTVNNIEHMKKLKSFGVSSIITNFPHILNKI